jgi:hypothetical protein
LALARRSKRLNHVKDKIDTAVAALKPFREAERLKVEASVERSRAIRRLLAHVVDAPA